MRIMHFAVLACMGSVIAPLAGVPDLREQVSLNGIWDKGGKVPMYDSQNSQFVDSTYERSVTIPLGWTGKIIKLEFNAVNHYCSLFVNNQFVGTHNGAWIPFAFDITNRVTPGQSFTLTLKVKGKMTWPTYVDGKVEYWIGHNDLDNKRSGIVDDVWLRAYGTVHIEDAFVKTSVQNKRITVEYTIVNTRSSSWSGTIKADIQRESNTTTTVKTLTSAAVNLAAGERKTISVSADWHNPVLWWPDSPVLYLLKSRVENGSATIEDRETRRFGFREFWVAGTQYRLNGIRFNALSDWCCFSQYWGSIPDPETLRAHYVKVKAQNVNFFRWHKHPPPRFALELADEMGLPVLAESPVYARSYLSGINHAQFIDRCVSFIPAWVKATRNHACVVMWSACNEMTYSFAGSYDTLLLKKLGDAIYALDSTRAVSYDGDGSVSGPIYNKHYPEGYEKNPEGNPYTAWKNRLHPSKPTHFGEILAVRPGTNNNGWWIGVWTRGLRYLDVAGIAPRVYYSDSRITAEQRTLVTAAYNPVALFDSAYDALGIAPFKDAVYPVLGEGTRQTRTLVLYNDEYRNTTVRAEARVTVNGATYARGSAVCNIPLGEHVSFTISFMVPYQFGKQMLLELRTYKNDSLRFEEKKIFLINNDVTNGSADSVITFEGVDPPLTSSLRQAGAERIGCRIVNGRLILPRAHSDPAAITVFNAQGRQIAALTHHGALTRSIALGSLVGVQGWHCISVEQNGKTQRLQTLW